MAEIDFIRDMAETTRRWREKTLEEVSEAGCTELSYRPRTGMSSLGWVLAHQAAVFDFTLNVLIRGESAKNAKMFAAYVPGTTGDWEGTPLAEIQEYYDSGEHDLLEWTENASAEEMGRVIEEGKGPAFFVGMTIRQVIANMFTHLNCHTGHLMAIKRDWLETPSI